MRYQSRQNETMMREVRIAFPFCWGGAWVGRGYCLRRYIRELSGSDQNILCPDRRGGHLGEYICSDAFI